MVPLVLCASLPLHPESLALRGNLELGQATDNGGPFVTASCSALNNTGIVSTIPCLSPHLDMMSHWGFSIKFLIKFFAPLLPPPCLLNALQWLPYIPELNMFMADLSTDIHSFIHSIPPPPPPCLHLRGSNGYQCLLCAGHCVQLRHNMPDPHGLIVLPRVRPLLIHEGE